MLNGGYCRVRDAAEGESLALLQGQVQGSGRDLRLVKSPWGNFNIFIVEIPLNPDLQQNRLRRYIKNTECCISPWRF